MMAGPGPPCQSMSQAQRAWVWWWYLGSYTVSSDFHCESITFLKELTLETQLNPATYSSWTTSPQRNQWTRTSWMNDPRCFTVFAAPSGASWRYSESRMQYGWEWRPAMTGSLGTTWQSIPKSSRCCKKVLRFTQNAAVQAGNFSVHHILKTCSEYRYITTYASHPPSVYNHKVHKRSIMKSCVL